MDTDPWNLNFFDITKETHGLGNSLTLSSLTSNIPISQEEITIVFRSNIIDEAEQGSSFGFIKHPSNPDFFTDSTKCETQYIYSPSYSNPNSYALLTQEQLSVDLQTLLASSIISNELKVLRQSDLGIGGTWGTEPDGTPYGPDSEQYGGVTPSLNKILFSGVYWHGVVHTVCKFKYKADFEEFINNAILLLKGFRSEAIFEMIILDRLFVVPTSIGFQPDLKLFLDTIFELYKVHNLLRSVFNTPDNGKISLDNVNQMLSLYQHPDVETSHMSFNLNEILTQSWNREYAVKEISHNFFNGPGLVYNTFDLSFSEVVDHLFQNQLVRNYFKENTYLIDSSSVSQRFLQLYFSTILDYNRNGRILINDLFMIEKNMREQGYVGSIPFAYLNLSRHDLLQFSTFDNIFNNI